MLRPPAHRTGEPSYVSSSAARQQLSDVQLTCIRPRCPVQMYEYRAEAIQREQANKQASFRMPLEAAS